MSALPPSTGRPLTAVLALLLLSACATAADPPPAAAPSPSVLAPATSGDVVVHAQEVPPLHPSVDGYTEELVDIETADGVRHRIAVLVAGTPEERQHGLMEVPSLPDGNGMLFVGYDEDRTGGFWMKDTLVPLTIAYLAADGTIVDVVDMEPCRSDPCPSYPPDIPYRSALEVPQGWLAEHGIGPGDVVHRGAG